jgi:hypothetical protein
MPRAVLALAFVCLLALLATPSAGLAAEPPNQNDPCSTAGRNSCGTLGVGFYREYRYGVRWFGDFRGAVPGEAHMFCLDFGFWYASAEHRYREVASAGLRNRDGEPVPVERQRRLAYAIWSHGRSGNASRQAAVALYVHSLMGDARPGEADPAGVGPRVAAFFDKIARDAARYHGPYRIAARFAPGLVAGRSASATIRVLSAMGNAVPDVRLTISTRGATGLPHHVRTNARGIARVPLRPTDRGRVRLSISAGPLAATLPNVFRATTALAATNGQRLAVPRAQRVTAAAIAPVMRRLVVSTAARPARIAAGETSSAQVRIRRALRTWGGTIDVRLNGPFASADAIRCDARPSWHGSIIARGPGVFSTPSIMLEDVGWYAFQEVVPGDSQHLGVTTRCGLPAASVRVEAQPRLWTVASSLLVTTGTAIFDRVHIQGLGGQTATIGAALYGPFPTREAVSCDTAPAWTGSLQARGDGEYHTQPFTLNAAGFYSYREWIDASGFVRSTETGCGETAQTVLARATPILVSAAAVPDQIVRPGARVSDRIRVRGLGSTEAAVQVDLFGPFASRAAIRCNGRPIWHGKVVVSGERPVRSPAVTVTRAGFYTYRERLLSTTLVAGSSSECASATRTLLATPKIVTGQGDIATYAAARGPVSTRPTRIRLETVEIDADISAVQIDLTHGTLGVPADIARAGWWKDGKPPGADAGAILIAGHVDSAREGRGAFFSLGRARVGDQVHVDTAGGRVFSYRVVSVRNHHKEALPTSVYSRTGAPRLVLVTCGGPFDQQTRRYRDNIVVTAVPASR